MCVWGGEAGNSFAMIYSSLFFLFSSLKPFLLQVLIVLFVFINLVHKQMYTMINVNAMYLFVNKIAV